MQKTPDSLGWDGRYIYIYIYVEMIGFLREGQHVFEWSFLKCLVVLDSDSSFNCLVDLLGLRPVSWAFLVKHLRVMLA